MSNTGENLSRLFELDFTRLEIVGMSIFPSLINFVIFFYVFLFLPRSRTNFSFAIFVFMVAMWQMSDGFMRLAQEAQTAEAWFRIMGVFALFVTPFGVFFTAQFAGWKRLLSSGWFFLSQFLPAIFFLILNTSGIETHQIVRSNVWHWIANPNQQLITSLIYFWVSFEGTLMLIMLWIAYVQQKKDPIKRKQAAMLAMGISIPLVGGVVTQSIVPLVLRMDNIPLTPAFFTFFSIFALIAMIHYGMLDYSPKHLWGKIVESMNDALLILNKNDEIMYANRKFTELSGYDKSEIIGKTPCTFFEFETDKKFRDGVSRKEVLLNTRKGQRIWTLFCTSPYQDHRGIEHGTVVICTNINESKSSETRFKALVENAGDMISLTDEKSMFRYSSPALEKITGYNGQELKNMSLFDLVHEDHLATARKNYEFILKHPGVLLPVYNKFVDRHGKEIWVEGAVINMLNVQDVQAIVSNHRDITDRKISEFKLKNLLDVTTNQNQRLQNFAHIVSHNIRSHVVNIDGLVQVISNREFETDRTRLIDMLKASTDKLMETTENLNEIITIQNNIDAKWAQINLHDEIRKTMSVINGMSKEKEVFIVNKVDKSAVIPAIPSYLESIILNLLTNAVKYSSPERTPMIVLENEENPEYSLLHVTDNGIGIDLDTYGGKIFGMYKTFHNNKDARGFGLFITKNQIEAMNGKITVSSKLGEGTRFTVYFRKELAGAI